MRIDFGGSVLVTGPFGSHYVCASQNAPDEYVEEWMYTLMTRVRNFDNRGGRIRVVRDPEYERKVNEDRDRFRSEPQE